MEQISFTFLEIILFFQVSKHYESLLISASEETCLSETDWNSSYFYLVWGRVTLLILLFSLNVWGFCCCLVEGLREGNGGSLQTMWLNMTGANQRSCTEPESVKEKHCCSFWENKHLCALQLSLYFGGGRKRVPANAVVFLSACDL